MPEERIRALEEKVQSLDERYSDSLSRVLGYHDALAEVTASLRAAVECNVHAAKALQVCEQLLRRLEEERFNA